MSRASRLHGSNALTFTFTPTLGTFSWSVAGQIFTSTQPTVEVNAPITFTAHPVFPPGSGRSVIDVKWNFGDGTTAFGLTAIHTFRFPNLQIRVHCCLVDNEGTEICVGQHVYPTQVSHLFPAPALFPSTTLYPH